MNQFKNAFTPPMWLTVSLLAAVVAGCGGGGDAGNSAAGDSVPMAARQKQSVAQAPVDLRSAGTFTILSKSGITDVYASAIVGNVGTSPITGAALLLKCTEVTGKIYVVDA